MGKAEVGTPKYLANKMKAKGLQKLRWYCQMCQKQCRDENGFKCHTTSESHQRQLLLFADNPGKFMHSFSQEFADGFLELLRRRFNTKRVQANKVYQEYISDKNHLHMNATKWLTLSDFVKWLGRTSQCVVDETEKGWFITYIDRSPEVIEQQEKAAKKEKMDKDDQERLMEFISKQVERNKKDDEPSTSYSEFKRENKEEKIKLDIKLESKPKPTSMFVKPIDLNKSSKRKSDDSSSSSYKKYRSDDYSSRSSSKSERRLNALEEIMELEEKKKEMANRKDYWLTEGIVVKLVTKKLGDRYYKQKAVVLDVIDKYCAKLRLLDSGDKVKVDQNYVETVLPAIGKQVRVLNGAYRGCTATLEELHEDKFCTTIKISSGPLTGRVLNNVQYEDICKIHLD